MGLSSLRMTAVNYRVSFGGLCNKRLSLAKIEFAELPFDPLQTFRIQVTFEKAVRAFYRPHQTK